MNTLLQPVTTLFRRFKKNSFPMATRKDALLWLLISVVFLSIGMVIALLSYREGLDTGDGSTFYQFAHNIFQGESIYRDFIHFRTPGSYFLQSLFISVFGDQQSSVNFALVFESHVLYVLFFMISLAVFLKFKHAFLGFVATGLITFLPAYAQLRTVLAFLAIVCFIHSYRVLSGKKWWLVASGIFIGLAFTFGQEAALIAIASLGTFEIAVLLRRRHGMLNTVKRVSIVAVGVLVGVLPLIVYIAIASDFSNFLYYTLYYAFIIQPQGMDLAYPLFSYQTVIFFIPFALLLLSFFVLFANRAGSNKAAESILLIFVCVRLVTLFGRSDIGHLIFILPELMFLSILSIYYIKSTSFKYSDVKKFVPYAVLLICIFVASVTIKSMIIVASGLVIGLAMTVKSTKLEESIRGINVKLVYLCVVTSIFSILVFLLVPYYMDTLNKVSSRGLTNVQVGGVNITHKQLSQINKVEDAVNDLKPETIFSYPIQPYFYSLAPKHASRFITFEPQTTSEEQDLAIQDLKKNKPEVIVFDSIQAASMSRSLWKINDFITANYQIYKIVDGDHPLWVMEERAESSDRVQYLMLMLYKDNRRDGSHQVLREINSPEKGIDIGVMQSAESEQEIKLDDTEDFYGFSTSIYTNSTEHLGSCGLVKISYGDGTMEKHDICRDNYSSDIKFSRKPKTITLKNTERQPIIWNKFVLITR